VRGANVKSLFLPAGDPPEARVMARALADAGKAYAIYIRGGSQLELAVNVPDGSYRAEWVNTKTGKVDKKEEFKPLGRDHILASPKYSEDIALRIKVIKKK